jgi:hypothetical protein
LRNTFGTLPPASLPEHTSTVESITITPLVEGSYTAWKVTVSIVNGSKLSLASMSPLFGLPAFPFATNIGTMFVEYATTKFLMQHQQRLPQR